jgi:hypothetical protein
MSENPAYRVSATVITPDDGKQANVSFIVRSGAGWKWAVEQAHQQLESALVLGEVSVDEIAPGAPERAVRPDASVEA